MKAVPGLVFIGLALALAGASFSYAQVPDPFTQQMMGGPPSAAKGNPGIDCNAEFQKHNTEIQKRGMALGEASKRKANVKDACGLLRQYVSAESGMVSFLKKYSSSCGIPPEILKQMLVGNTKSSAMRDQVCKAASGQVAGGAPPPPPPPSQGLSGVLGGGSSSTNNPGGTGVFDSLTGNVLRQ